MRSPCIDRGRRRASLARAGWRSLSGEPAPGGFVGAFAERLTALRA